MNHSSHSPQRSLYAVYALVVLVLSLLGGLVVVLLPQPGLHGIGFHVHVLLALAAYGLLGTAAMHAGVMLWQQHHLHAQQGKAWVQRVLDTLPPVLSMETLLFRQLWAGFVLLSLSLVSGFAFATGPVGLPQVLNHKTLFALAAWLTFAVLLAGRMALGWRGRAVLRACLGGYCALILAYFGTQFVLQVVLQRGV